MTVEILYGTRNYNKKRRKEVTYVIKFLCYFINFDCKVNSCCKNYKES